MAPPGDTPLVSGQKPAFLSEAKYMALSNSRPVQTGPDERSLQRILDAIKDLRYGSVEVVVHDGKVVQIERKEKIRIDTQR